MAKKVSGLNVSLEGDAKSIQEATKKGVKAVAEYSEEVVKHGKKAAAGMRQSAAGIQGQLALISNKLVGWAKGGGGMGGIAGSIAKGGGGILMGALGGPAGIALAVGGVAAVGTAFLALKATTAVASAGIRTAFDLAQQGGQALLSKMLAMVPQIKATGLLGGTLGVDPGALVAIREVFGDVGLEAGQADASIQSLVVNLGNAGAGFKKSQAVFQGLGLDFKKLAQMNTADAFGTVLARIAQIPTAAGRAAASMKVFGADLQDVMAQGPAAIQEALAGASALGQTYTAEQAAMVNQMAIAMDGVGDAWEGLATQLTVTVAPYITAALQMLTDWIAGGDGMKGKVGQAVQWMGDKFLFLADVIGREVPARFKLFEAGLAELMVKIAPVVNRIQWVATNVSDLLMGKGPSKIVPDVIDAEAWQKTSEQARADAMAMAAAPLPSKQLSDWGNDAVASAQSAAKEAAAKGKQFMGGGADFELPEAAAKKLKVKDRLTDVNKALKAGKDGWDEYGRAAKEAADEYAAAQRTINQAGVGSLALSATGTSGGNGNSTPVSVTPVTRNMMGGAPLGPRVSVPAEGRTSVFGPDKQDTVIQILKQILGALQDGAGADLAVV